MSFRAALPYASVRDSVEICDRRPRERALTFLAIP